MSLRLAAIILFAFLLLCGPALAIGIGPGRIEVDFEPGAEQDYPFQVLNNEDRQLDIEIYASGDLAEYVTLSQMNATLFPGETKIFSFHVKMPETLEPGKHDTRIGAVEVVSPEAPLAARAGVELQFWVYAPYPEKYIAIDVVHSEPRINESMEFNITLSNPVKVNLMATADLEILKDNAVLERFELGEVYLPSGSSHVFQARWTPSEEGGYKAVVRANYEGEVSRKEIGFGIEVPRPEPQPEPKEKEEEEQSILYSPYTLLIALIIIAIIIVWLWPQKKMKRKR